VAVSPADVEALVVNEERANLQSRAATLLAAALGRLDPRDRLIMRLRFEDGLTMRRIATMLQVEDAAPLYRRVDRLKEHLRHELEAAGLAAAEVHEFLADPDGPRANVLELSQVGARGGRTGVRPSL